MAGKCPKCGRFGMKSKRHHRFGEKYYTYTYIYCGYSRVGREKASD